MRSAKKREKRKANVPARYDQGSPAHAEPPPVPNGAAAAPPKQGADAASASAVDQTSTQAPLKKKKKQARKSKPAQKAVGAPPPPNQDCAAGKLPLGATVPRLEVEPAPSDDLSAVQHSQAPLKKKKKVGKGKAKMSTAFSCAVEEHELLGDPADEHGLAQIFDEVEAAAAAKPSLRPPKVQEPRPQPLLLARWDGGGECARERTPPMTPPPGFFGAGSSDSGQTDSD